MTDFDTIDRNPDPRTLAAFRWTLLAGTAVVAAILRWGAQRPSAAIAVAAVGLALILLSLVPGLGRPLYVGWMFFGLALGRVTSPIVLGVVWCLLFVPLGIFFRLAGRDTMKRRFDPVATTYWEPHPPPAEPRRYFRQF